MKMGRVMSFLVWLFSFWTWKDFFPHWLQSRGRQSREIAKHLPSQEGQPESELARFLSSLPEDEHQCNNLLFRENSKVEIGFGGSSIKLFHGIDVEASYKEFLEAVASSKIVFRENVGFSLSGDNSCKHVEAFADALRQSSHGFKRLIFLCQEGAAIRFASCISSVLIENNDVQHLDLHMMELEEEMDKELVKEFMAIIARPHSLQILKSFELRRTKINIEGIEQLMKFFHGPSSALENLKFDDISSNVQLEHISAMLASSTSLKTLSIFNYSYKLKKKAFTRGCKSIATALCSNQSLESLTFEISSSLELKALLDPFIPKTNNLQCNTTVTNLGLTGSIGGKEGIEILADMICTNSSLLELGLIYMDDLSSSNIEGTENVLTILEALKTNKSWKRIDLQGCTAVGGYKVLGAMMDLLLENHCIEDIKLDGTSLKKSGDANYVYAALSKRKKVKLWGIVQGMANVKPTSGRVFLCGNPYAGKTRLRMSMKELKEFRGKGEVQKHSRIREKIKNPFKTSNASKVVTKDLQLERTHGIEVDSVQCDDIGITIWDMAGQTDYHSFHELVMPNLSADGSCSMFLLMCNPTQQSSSSSGRRLPSIKVELESWLRFIASNTRRSLAFRPHVSIVMTHFDYWKDDHAFAARIDDVVLELKIQFQEILEFDEDKSVFKVDGRDESHARGVFDFIKLHLKQLLEGLPKTIRACEEVQCLVTSWNVDKPKHPLLKWDKFCEGMCKEVKELNDVDEELARRRKEFVAIALNDGGHIIYNEQEGVVITNPHWFCHDIIGQFLHQCTIEGPRLDMVSPNGIISIDHVQRIVLDLIEGQGDMEKQFDDILGMMMKLHICYEQDANHIMIPSTLKNKLNHLNWSTHDEVTSFTYVGRRLTCKDKTKTMMTPSFFTRLQVSFFKMLQSKNAQDTYEVFQDVIKFISEGIEVILQFNYGDIDILLRSHQSQDNMMEFLENGILMHIKHVQRDPTLGCLGVVLEDYILRPACVEKLLHPMDRKNQFVHMKDLEVEVIKNGVDATYNWKSCENLGVGFNKVKTLIGGLAWKKLLERRSLHLQEYHKEILSFKPLTPNDPSKCNEKDALSTTSLWQMPQRFLYGTLDAKIDQLTRENREQHKETMSKLEDVVQLIQGLERGIKIMQGELLQEVCSRIDDLMAFSVEMQKSQIPKLAYLCESGKKELLTRWVPDLNKIQLHLMCESRHGFHEVASQEGCVVHFGTEHTKRFLAMLFFGLKMATILTKIGAHVACGMGAMVPDFSDGVSFTALILDTSGLLDYHIPSTSLESLPNDLRNQSRMSIDDNSKVEAQRWLREFLEPLCQNKREFYGKFKLNKVRYRGVSGSVAWICDVCISRHPKELDEWN